MAGKTEEARLLEKIRAKESKIKKHKTELVKITIPPHGENLPTDEYLTINGKTITIRQDPVDFTTVEVPKPYARLYKNKLKARRESEVTRARILRMQRRVRAD